MNIKKSYMLLTAAIMLFGMFLAARPAVAEETTPPAEGAAPTPGSIVFVKKTALGSSSTDWTWTIEKVGDQSALTLSTGQSHLVNYKVTLTPQSKAVWEVHGVINIRNISSSAVVITSVTDVLSNGANANVSCPFPIPLTLQAGFTTPPCTYMASGTGTRPTENTATAYIDGETGIVEGDSDIVPVNYSSSTETDECVAVSDEPYGPLATVCAAAAPKTFSYSLTVGPYDVCGTYQFINIAKFVTNDTGTEGSSSWTVNIDVPCAGGCTLTPGYWKTHSKYGPAPYDSLWGTNTAFHEDTAFYSAGKSYYNVLWTPPQGNAYFILARAFIAARLNILNGAATTSAVNSALSWADTFFTIFSPSSTLTKEMRSAVIVNASLLDSYNNGLTGPGHCSE